MEPDLGTGPEVELILPELIACEALLHRPGFGTTRDDFERMISADFWETGASGRRYSRAFVLEELERRSKAPEEIWETSDFHCRKISSDTYLLTYTLLQNRERLTRRLTIWKHGEDGWKAEYQQGTIVEGS